MARVAAKERINHLHRYCDSGIASPRRRAGGTTFGDRETERFGGLEVDDEFECDGRPQANHVSPECFVSSVLLGELQQLVSAHGYWVVALIVGLESMGLPLPGETILVLAAIYAAIASTLEW
jgi:hypothetical protein